MHTNSSTIEPSLKKADLQIIYNFLMRIITHFGIETVKNGTRLLPKCGGVYENSPKISKDWVTVHVTHDCLSAIFVKFIEKINPILISKGYSHLDVDIINDKGMSFAVDFNAKSILPHNLPIKGDEALFDLFAKNWKEVFQSDTYFGKNRKKRKYTKKNDPTIKGKADELKSLLKAGVKSDISAKIKTCGLRFASGGWVSYKGVSFIATSSPGYNIPTIKWVRDLFPQEVEINIVEHYHRDNTRAGFIIKLSYEAVKAYSQIIGVTVTQISEQSKEKRLSFTERAKRKRKLGKMIPAIKEIVYPIIKQTGLWINNSNPTGISIYINTQLPRTGDLYVSPEKVLNTLEKEFGKHSVSVKELKSNEKIKGYSISFSYEKANELFSGKETSMKAKPVTMKSTIKFNSGLEEWATVIIVDALSKATIEQLMTEISGRGEHLGVFKKLFISGFETEFLLAELEKRVGSMSPQEKLKLIQLFSK